MAFKLTVEDSSPLISYAPAGAWADSPSNDASISSYSQLSYHRASAPGATATIKFTGTGISVFGGKRPEYGTYSVTLNGQPISSPETASAPEISTKQLLASASGLEHARHIIVITSTSESPIDIDYAEVEGRVGTTAGAKPVETIYDDADSRITYLPSAEAWTVNNRDTFMGKTLHFSDAPDASATLSFAGEAVALYGTVSPDHANVRVTIDGRETLLSGGSSGESSALHPQTLLWYTDKLGPEQHTLQITSDQQGAARFVDVDRITVFSASGGEIATIGQTASLRPDTTSTVELGTPTGVFETSRPTDSAPATSSGSMGLPVAAIAGIAVGAAVTVLLFIAVVLLILRRRRRANGGVGDEAYQRQPASPVLPMQEDSSPTMPQPLYGQAFPDYRPDSRSSRPSSMATYSVYPDSRPGSRMSEASTSQIIPYYDYSNSMSSASVGSTAPMIRSDVPNLRMPRPASRLPVTYNIPSRPMGRSITDISE